MEVIAALVVLWGVLMLVVGDHLYRRPTQRGPIPDWGWEVLEASAGAMPVVILAVLLV